MRNLTSEEITIYNKTLENKLINSGGSIFDMYEDAKSNNELKLIDRAIESALCRIYWLKENKKGGSIAHQIKARNQVDLQKITIKALGYYKESLMK